MNPTKLYQKNYYLANRKSKALTLDERNKIVVSVLRKKEMNMNQLSKTLGLTYFTARCWLERASLAYPIYEYEDPNSTKSGRAEILYGVLDI